MWWGARRNIELFQAEEGMEPYNEHFLITEEVVNWLEVNGGKKEHFSFDVELWGSIVGIITAIGFVSYLVLVCCRFYSNRSFNQDQDIATRQG